MREIYIREKKKTKESGDENMFEGKARKGEVLGGGKHGRMNYKDTEP